MDTRYWGPSGWSLLHSIASAYHPTRNCPKRVQHFFDSLPTVLPCIYCRRSLADYYQQLPLKPSYLTDNRKFQCWLYRIHNLVNGKLRNQGLPVDPDPRLSDIINKFSGHEETACLHGWDFLYAIAMNYPEDPQLITVEQRHGYRKFFDNLASVLPNHRLRSNLVKYLRTFPLGVFLHHRDSLVKWLYGLEKTTMVGCPCFQNRCRSVEKYRAGCKGKGDTRPTCRRIKSKSN